MDRDDTSARADITRFSANSNLPAGMDSSVEATCNGKYRHSFDPSGPFYCGSASGASCRFGGRLIPYQTSGSTVDGRKRECRMPR